MKNSIQILSRLKSILVILLVTALVGLGCNFAGGQNAPTVVPPLVFPTLASTNTPTVLLATETQNLPTSAPPTAPPPTAVPPTSAPPPAAPAPTTIPGAVRIHFATGATSGVVQGELAPGQIQNFLVGAAQGQPLMVSTGSSNNDVTFSVVGLKDGKTLLDASQKLSSWQTMLTVTQDYLVQVIGGSSKENFVLNIITSARIKFDPGAISATIKGFTPGGLIVSYVLRASINQQMDINLSAPDGNAVLGVYGYQDGYPYLRSVVESTTFSMVLPATQDYIVQIVPRAGEIANYTMTVTIK